MITMTQRVSIKTALSVLCVFLALFCGCGSNKNTSSADVMSLRIGTPMDVRQTNLLADYGYSIFAMLATHETLVRFDSAMHPVPQLAKSWESSPDAKQWTFHLREDALWHDGRPVTPEDVKFTFEYLAAHHSASAWIKDLISDIRIDGSNVTFLLTKPYSRFLINVGFIVRILPQHVWQQVSDPLIPGRADVTLGCGPFVFDGFDDRGNRIMFRKNKTYYGSLPSIERLEFFTHLTFDALTLSLIRGDIDVYYKYASGFPPPYLPKLMEGKQIQIISADAMGIPAALGFNLKQGPASIPAFRKALALAIDYGKITQSLLRESGKIPSAVFVPPACEFHLKWPSLSFSPEQSRRLLSDAGFMDTDHDGYLNHPGGGNLSLKLLTRSDLEGEDALLPILSYNLKQVGINMAVEQADLSTWIARVHEGRFDLVLFRTTPWGMVMDAGCGSGYFDSRRAGGGTLANIEDPVFHGLCDRILETIDPSDQRRLYHDMQRYYAEQLPAVALCWTVNTYPASNRLDNLVVNPIEGGLANRETFARVRFTAARRPVP
jgi:peptide/nickel transport system substrate-binding protein